MVINYSFYVLVFSDIKASKSNFKLVTKASMSTEVPHLLNLGSTSVLNAACHISRPSVSQLVLENSFKGSSDILSLLRDPVLINITSCPQILEALKGNV